jgi:hypothetical protein
VVFQAKRTQRRRIKERNVMRRILVPVLVMLAAVTVAKPALSAPVKNGSTVLSFEYPQGTPTSSAGLHGAGITDVWIKTTTTSSVGQPYIDDGKLQLLIATDGLGNPTTVAGAVEWVRIDQSAQGGLHPTLGVGYFEVDLDGLYDLNILDASGDRLQNVTCANTTVGFRAHYITGGGSPHVDTHQSLEVPLTIDCGLCGNSTALTIGIELASGDGSPYPGASGPWTFRLTTTNCTGVDLNGVKVQGGSNGWAPIPSPFLSYVSYDRPGLLEVKGNNKNQVVTWTGDLPYLSSVKIDVTVTGTIKPGNPCTPILQTIPEPGSVLFLSGPWSAAYTWLGLPAKTPYTDRVALVVTCP